MHEVLDFTDRLKSILIDFTRWGIQRGEDFDDITIDDIDRYAEEWVDEHVEKEPLSDTISSTSQEVIDYYDLRNIKVPEYSSKPESNLDQKEPEPYLEQVE